jgi:PAS domain S-box-containing protein
MTCMQRLLGNAPISFAVALVVLVLSLGVTAVVWRVTDAIVASQARRAFSAEARVLQVQIERQLAAYEVVLAGAAGLLDPSKTVTRSEWRNYVASLDLTHRLPRMVGLGYAARLRPQDLSAHVADVQSQGYPAYRVRPPGPREEYAPITFNEPLDAHNQRALGYDMFSEATRRDAMAAARDRGRPSLSGKVRLVADEGETQRAALFFYMPVYRDEALPRTVGARRGQLTGYVFAVFYADSVFQDMFDPATSAVAFDIYDGQTTAPDALLFHSGTAIDHDADSHAHDHRLTVAFDAPGRQWTATFHPTPAYDIQQNLAFPTKILVGGIVLSSVLFAVVLVLTTRLSRARSIATSLAERTTQSEARFRDLFWNSPDAILLVSRDGRIRDINREVESNFGYGRDELLGVPVDILVPDDRRTDHIGKRDEFWRAPTVREMAARDVAPEGRRKDGSTFPIDVSLIPLNAGAEPTVAAVVRDLSDKIAAETQLRQAQKMESIGQLTGGIAHDFNNLLTVVVTNLDILIESFQDEPEKHQLAEGALQSALRGAELTRSLLIFSRQRPPEPLAKAATTQLGVLLANTIGLLRRTLGEQIRLSIDLPDDLWPMSGDASQVEEAIFNLSINARDAMPDGGTLTLSAANVTLDETYTARNPDCTPGDYVMLAVTDTGIGMPQEVIDRAFEPFFTTKEPGKGTGLGLSVVYAFAKSSGGHLKIYSEVGHGTTVRLYLRRATGKDVAAAAEQAGGKELVGGSESILIVEDNEPVRDSACRILGNLGYRIETADSGPAALAMLEGGRHFDLLFTDVVMPDGMTGYDLADEALRRAPGIKVLITTGYARGTGDRNNRAAVSYSLLRKPYRRIELAMQVRAVLDATA